MAGVRTDVLLEIALVLALVVWEVNPDQICLSGLTEKSVFFDRYYDFSSMSQCNNMAPRENRLLPRVTSLYFRERKRSGVCTS